MRFTATACLWQDDAYSMARVCCLLADRRSEWRTERTTAPRTSASVESVDLHLITFVVDGKPQFSQRRQSDGELDHERNHGPRTARRIRRYRYAAVHIIKTVKRENNKVKK